MNRTMQEQVAALFLGDDAPTLPAFGRVVVTRDRSPTGYDRDPVPETDERGAPLRQPPKVASHRQWAQHSVDMNSHYHGKRRSKRGDARQVYLGAGLALGRSQDAGSFIRGKGLSRSPARFALYIQGKCRGYLSDINAAMAWQLGAQAAGCDGAYCEDRGNG